MFQYKVIVKGSAPEHDVEHMFKSATDAYTFSRGCRQDGLEAITVLLGIKKEGLEAPLTSSTVK
jgi:hypothetical protein